MNIRRFSLIIFFILLAIISFLLLIPSPPKLAAGFRFIDKIEHFSVFLVLTVLLLFGTGGELKRRTRMLFFSAVMLGVYGALIELLQKYTGRSAELFDLIADFAGIIAGCFVSLFFL